jgi:hypothetical protein
MSVGYVDIGGTVDHHSLRSQCKVKIVSHVHYIHIRSYLLIIKFLFNCAR